MLVAVYMTRTRSLTGYFVYYIANDVFRIKELVYVNQERRATWACGTISPRNFSMIEKVVGNNYTNEPMAFLEDSEIGGGNRAVYHGAHRRFLRSLSGSIRLISSPSTTTSYFIIDDLIMWSANLQRRRATVGPSAAHARRNRPLVTFRR